MFLHLPILMCSVSLALFNDYNKLTSFFWRFTETWKNKLNCWKSHAWPAVRLHLGRSQTPKTSLWAGLMVPIFLFRVCSALPMCVCALFQTCSPKCTAHVFDFHHKSWKLSTDYFILLILNGITIFEEIKWHSCMGQEDDYHMELLFCMKHRCIHGRICTTEPGSPRPNLAYWIVRSLRALVLLHYKQPICTNKVPYSRRDVISTEM